MTVSIAVTNSASIWSPKNVPRMAKMPTTTITSWSSAAMRGDAHPEVAEAEGDPEHDADRAEDDEQERLLDELGADDRTDGRLLQHLVDGAEVLPRAPFLTSSRRPVAVMDAAPVGAAEPPGDAAAVAAAAELPGDAAAVAAAAELPGDAAAVAAAAELPGDAAAVAAAAELPGDAGRSPRPMVRVTQPAVDASGPGEPSAVGCRRRATPVRARARRSG